jgi:hypothetical protein
MANVYVISYQSEYMATGADGGKQALHVFSKLEDARKFYLKKFVAPFLKKHKVADYFKFDPLKATTADEWKDIFITFAETAIIEEVPFN